MKLNLTEKLTTPVFIKRENGKKEVTFLEKWEHARVRTKEEISKHLRRENAGLALLTGKQNGITVIDFDSFYDVTMAELYQVSPTWNVVTPRGVHFYYQYNDKFPQGANVFGDKRDCRNDGGLIFCPPTPGYKKGELHEIEKMTEAGEQFLLKLMNTEPKKKFTFISKEDILKQAKEKFRKTKEVKYYEKIKELEAEIKKQKSSKVTEQMIEHAKEYPIEKLVEVNKCGLAKCIMPEHNDHKPSMNCRNNYAFCHACGGRNLPGKKSGYIGDVIDVYRIIHNASFEEAVKALQ